MLETSVSAAKAVIKANSIDAAVLCASSDYLEALRFVKKNPGAYLYFLDIDFGKSELNGVDIAKIIKKAEPLSKIVFVTSHAEMGIGVLKSGAEAFGFIEKTMNMNKMNVEYKKYILLAAEGAPKDANGRGDDENHVSLLVGIDEYVSIPVSRILYVEADKSASHFIRYLTVDGSSVSVRSTIENALKNLGDGFMKSHRSVVINMSHVVSVSDGLVKFAGGETAACSFRLKADVMKKCGLR